MQQPCVRIPTRIQVDALMLRIRQILGIGAFVVVYKAVDEEEPWQIYALKEVLCLNASQFHNAVREVQILKQLSHENVISLIGVDHLHDAQGLHMLILTEFCVGGNLKERLHRPSSDETNERWIRKISSAVAYLHLHDIVHLDLKADNVLLTATGDIKLADFGLAREFIPVKQFVEYGDDGSGMMSYIQKYIDSRVGPPHWVAPEFFHRRYNKRADSFSLGTLIFGILVPDFIIFRGRAYYCAYVSIPQADVRGHIQLARVGIGFAMATYDPNITIQFSRARAQGSTALQRIALNAMQYNKDRRPSAAEIYNRVRCIQQWNAP